MIHHQRSTILLAVMAACSLVGGCVSDRINDASPTTAYQRRLARSGPQQRLDAEVSVEQEPLGLLKPVEEADGPVPDLRIVTDPNTGRKVVELTVEQAIAMTLAGSPEIRVISFDPEIARQEIAAAAGVFDPAVFGRVNYEDQDSPANSIYEPGRAETRLFESGVRQRTPLGTEWSASYALARIWDDLAFRPLPTRYEPAVIFEFRQPLLRDAWQEVNLAGVDIARLNYEAALLGFRERVEEVSGGVAITYWRLTQARRDMEIQRQLVEQTDETLRKVEGRRDIDATDVQIKQAQTYAMSRQATLLELQKRVVDAQDALVRLIADPRVNTTMELEIVPQSEPQSPEEVPEPAAMTDRALATAMQRNPVVQRAHLGVEVAEINVRVAQNQKMPRLDLVGSTRARGLAQDYPAANSQIGGTDYVSYSVGLTFEVPLGNRQRQAEWMRRKLEQRKAISTLHGTADRVALVVKEAIRRVRTNLEQAQIQRRAVEAARIHLMTLEEAEQVRDRLTPEFLLVKLQAQETYAQTQRAESAALVELNVAMAELAQNTGTLQDLRMIESSMASVVEAPSDEDEPQAAPEPRRLLPPLPRTPSL
jgi:outer membrane protein TolC